MSKVVNEDFQLKKDGYYGYPFTWNGEKIYLYYTDVVDVRFWDEMVFYAIDKYLEEHKYFIDNYFKSGFYIYPYNEEGSKELKVIVNTGNYKNYEVTDDATVKIICGEETVLKTFVTFKELVYAIMECFDKLITTGHIEEPQETTEADAERVKTLKLMHSVMMSMNNENAYHSWIVTGVPDGATEEDYVDIALDDDEYEDMVDLFDRLFKRYAKDGLFKPSSEEAQFAKDKCRELNIPEIEILRESMKRVNKRRLNESVPAKAKKEIAGWWKEVEAWNEKKQEYNISNDYDDVEGMHTAMFDMLDELKSRNKDLYEKGRKIYNKYSDIPIKKSKVREEFGDAAGATIVKGTDGHRYAKSSSKSVRDSDDFWTDYTAWIDLNDIGHVIFIFGDNDLYNPDNTSPDWECDTAEEAQEWFNNYDGFAVSTVDIEDNDYIRDYNYYDEIYGDLYDESLNKSLTETRSLARPFKKDAKITYKAFDRHRDSVRNSNAEMEKKWKEVNGTPMDDRARDILLDAEPESPDLNAIYSQSVGDIERKDYPFYVTYYEERPHYHPEEGGYYVAGRYASSSEGFDSKKEAVDYAKELADKFGLKKISNTYYNKPSKYIGDAEHIWIETAREYLSHEKGDTPYE